MPRKQYDLCIRGREYTDKNGNIKNAWENIGAVMQGDKGPYMFLKRTFNPAGVEVEPGRESILVSMFEPKSGGNSGDAPAESMEPPQYYTDKDGSQWMKEAGKNWVKVAPANDPRGDFEFADGPDVSETPDIPF